MLSRLTSQDDRQQQVEHGEQDRWQHTLDDTLNNARGIAEPSKPAPLWTESRQIGKGSDEGT